MASPREQILYVAFDTTGHCRPVAPDRQSPSLRSAICYLGQLLEEGWQLVSESPDGRSESSIVLLRRHSS